MSTNDNKRFYWLKLKKDFFKQHEIKIVEGMPNGKDYILFYLKLLVESVSHEGMLRFSETIPYNMEMLSTLTNTNIDVVRCAMKIFTELQMITVMDDASIYMNEVEKLIGSETGQTQRKNLAKINKGGKNYPEFTPNIPQRLEIRDKSLDSKLEAASETINNIDFENRILDKSNQIDVSVFTYYERNIAPLIPIIGDKLKALIDEVGEIKVRGAIQEAATHNARSYAYIEAVARGNGKPKQEVETYEEKKARIIAKYEKEEAERRKKWTEE